MTIIRHALLLVPARAAGLAPKPYGPILAVESWSWRTGDSAAAAQTCSIPSTVNGADVRAARATPAEGPRTDEPQAHQGTRRRYRRDRAEDHPRHRGGRTRPAAAGEVARPSLPAGRD